MYSVALALLAGANAVAIANVVSAHNSGSIASTDEAIQHILTSAAATPKSTQVALGSLDVTLTPTIHPFNLSVTPTSTTTTAPTDLTYSDLDPFAPFTDGRPDFTTSFEIIPAGNPTEIYASDLPTGVNPTTVDWTYSTSSPHSPDEDSDSDSEPEDDNPLDSDLPYRKSFAFQFSSSSDDQLEVQVDAANAPTFSEGGEMLLSAPKKNSEKSSKNNKSNKPNRKIPRGSNNVENEAFNPRNLIQKFDSDKDDAVWITRYAPPSTTTLTPPAASTVTMSTTASAQPVTSISTVTNTVTSTTTSTTTQAVYVTVPVSAGSSASVPTITVTNTATVTLPASNFDESSVTSASSSNDPCAQSYTLGYIDGADWGYQYGFNDGSHGMYYRPPHFATGSYPTAVEPTPVPTEALPTASAEPTLSQPYSQQYSTISYYVPYGVSPYQYGPYGGFQPQPEPQPYGAPSPSQQTSAEPSPQLNQVHPQSHEEVSPECPEGAQAIAPQASVIPPQH